MDNKNYVSDIWELYDALRGAFFFKNIGFSVIRLVFLKYASDNCLGAYTREEMQDYIRVQRQFAARDVDGGPNAVRPVLMLIDREYDLHHLIESTINDYARELFGLDESWNRKNATSRNFARIMSVLSRMDLTDDLTTFEKGKAIVEVLISNLNAHGETAKASAPYYSSQELNTIAKALLAVSDNETYLDFCSGVGTSTISIVGDSKSRIFHCDVNEEMLSVSAMLLIMSGHSGFVLTNQDCLDTEERGFEINDNFVGEPVMGIAADKIFVDPPLGLKCRGNSLRESYYVAVQKAVATLKEGGKAIVAVPGGALFNSANKSKLFKEYLLGNGYIEAVVSLPITWSSTAVTVNFLLVSKNRNSEIYFFNGCSEECKRLLGKELKTKGPVQISDNGLKWITDILVNKHVVECVSRFVSYDEILNKEFDIIPTQYIQDRTIFEDVSLSEIDAELKSLYERLATFI